MPETTTFFFLYQLFNARIEKCVLNNLLIQIYQRFSLFSKCNQSAITYSWGDETFIKMQHVLWMILWAIHSDWNLKSTPSEGAACIHSFINQNLSLLSFMYIHIIRMVNGSKWLIIYI